MERTVKDLLLLINGNKLPGFLKTAFDKEKDKLGLSDYNEDEVVEVKGVYMIQEELSQGLKAVNARVYHIEGRYFWEKTDNSSLEDDYDLQRVIDNENGLYLSPLAILEKAIDMSNQESPFVFSIEESFPLEYTLAIDFGADYCETSHVRLMRHEVEFMGTHRYYYDPISLSASIIEYAQKHCSQA